MRHYEINSNIIYDTSINVPNIRYTLIVSLTVKIFVWYVCQREIECTHYTYLKVFAKKLSSSSLTLVSCQRLCFLFLIHVCHFPPLCVCVCFWMVRWCLEKVPLWTMTLFTIIKHHFNLSSCRQLRQTVWSQLWDRLYAHSNGCNWTGWK